MSGDSLLVDSPHQLALMAGGAALLSPPQQTEELETHAHLSREATTPQPGSYGSSAQQYAANPMQQQNTDPVPAPAGAFSTGHSTPAPSQPLYSTPAAFQQRGNAIQLPSLETLAHPPKLCYTITTYSPLPLLQQLQITSRAICEAAAAGAIAAAATIPGGPPAILQSQRSGMDPSTGCPANWLKLVKQLDAAAAQLEGGTPAAALDFSAVPAALLAPECTDLQADSLHSSSAQLLQEMRSDDYQQQLQLRALQRQMQLLEQHKRQQDMQEAAVVFVKRRCFDTRAAAFNNNLSVQCCRPPSDSPSACQRSGAHARARNSNQGAACTPTHASCAAVGSPAAASPHATSFNNNGGQGLSPTIPDSPQPVITASVLHPAAAAVVAAAATSPAQLALPGPSSQLMWLLKPSEREAAAAEAFREAAYAAAAAHGVPADAMASIAKQLAVAAVHTVTAQQGDAAGWTGQGMVPQACRLHTASPTPTAADPSSPLGTPRGATPQQPQCPDAAASVPERPGTADCQTANLPPSSYMTPSKGFTDSQQQAAGQWVAAAAWGSAGWGAGCAYGSSAQAAPCGSGWQQKSPLSRTPQQAAGTPALGSSACPPAATPEQEGYYTPYSDYTQQGFYTPYSDISQQAYYTPYSQQAYYTPYDDQGYVTAYTEGYTTPVSYFHYPVAQQGQYAAEPVCPQSPMLEGVDVWSDRCTVLACSHDWPLCDGAAAAEGWMEEAYTPEA